MSVISMENRAQRRAASSNRARASQAQAASTIEQTDEFVGYWLNLGVQRQDGTFHRLNRGVAVSDLFVRQIYEATDPARKEELILTNKIVTALQNFIRTGKLGEGEHKLLGNLQVCLYRKMEGSDGTDGVEDSNEIADWLFGEGEADTDGDDDAEAAAKAEAEMEAEVQRRVDAALAAKAAATRKSAAKAALDDENVLGAM